MASLLFANRSSAATANSLTTAELALKASLDPAEFRDVHLYAFSRRILCLSAGTVRIDCPLPVSAVGSILKDTEYFSNLLTSGFSEGNPNAAGPIRQSAHPSEYDYEADSDLDEFEESESEALPIPRPSSVDGQASDSNVNVKGKVKSEVGNDTTPGASSGDPAPDINRHRILLPSVAHKTLRACIFYLYTGKVDFLPLTSEATKDRRSESVATAANATPACSPKSMYRLAELYGISELQDLAYTAIISRLGPKNVVEEAFSSFFARYERLQEHAVSYISKHYLDPSIQEGLRDALDRVVLGETPHAGGVLRSLLGLRMAVNGPPPSQTVPPPTANTTTAQRPSSPSHRAQMQYFFGLPPHAPRGT